MSANIDTMMYVGEVPWHGKGIDLTDNPPKTGQEIIKGAKLDWRVNYEEMFTENHGKIPGVYTLYREDTDRVFGVVQTQNLIQTQNIDMFNAFDLLLSDNSIKADTAASLGIGTQVFGCFKISDTFNVAGDSIDHYLVVLNDHMKPNGKITILNTPVRVVCQNTLSAALSDYAYRLSVPVSDNEKMNNKLVESILKGVDTAISQLDKTATKLINRSIGDDYIEATLDALFPYVKIPDLGIDMYSKQNTNITIQRETFMNECWNADNMQNIKYTQYGIFNALTDFSQHYFRKMEDAMNINHTMKLLPKIGDNQGSKSLVTKFLSIKDDLYVA